MLEKKVDTSAILDEAETLNPYAVRLHYPQEIDIDDAQTKSAISEAQKIKEWAEKTMRSAE